MVYNSGMKLFKLFLIVLPFMVALDFSWAAFVANKFYADKLGAPRRAGTRAVLSSVLARYRLLLGAFLGLVGYGMYDLVNLGVITGYPLSVTIVDIIWGTVVTGAVTSIGYLLGKKLVRLY
jgi:uncharacterized membrane protein